MRKLLVTSLIALLTVAASAQANNTRTGVQTGSSSTKTSLTPSSSSAREGTSTTSQKATTQPSSAKTQQPAANSRTTSADTGTGASQTKTTTNTTANTSTTNQNAGTTARGVSTTAAQKTTEVKVVNPVRVKWMTLEEALEKSKTDKRKIFVNVYTDGSGWCKRMDTTTFVSPVVAQYLNDHYYPVKFDAEQQKDIVFKDKTYQFKKSGASGYHELAAQWLNNRLTYPTVVFLDENQSTIQPLAGYQDAAKMEAVLNYFGTDSHKKTPWETYQKNFKSQKE